jgi:hypothetical protein
MRISRSMRSVEMTVEFSERILLSCLIDELFQLVFLYGFLRDKRSSDVSHWPGEKPGKGN